MTIQVGDKVPDVTLMEYLPAVGEGCGIGPRPVSVKEAVANKTIAIVGVPGAFTPTCSASHLPGYIHHAEAFREAGVDEIWCVSVNDAFVMGAWALDQKTNGKVRMLADGDAAFAKATGLVLDLTGKGLGLRSERYSILVRDGVVTALNVEVGGALAVSDAGTLLEQARKAGGKLSSAPTWSASDYVTKTLAQHPLTIFTTTTCPYCTLAKRVLSSVKASYHEVNIDTHEHGTAVFNEIEKRTGRSTVPNVFVNGKSIGGGSDVEQLQKEGKLVDLLKAGGVVLA